MATIHLSKGAPKSTRLDAAGIRKRAATKGDVVVEVKPGEEVVSVNAGWTVEKFVEAVKKKPERRSQNDNGHKPAAKASANGKGKTASANGRKPVKKAASKKPTAKTKTAKTLVRKGEKGKRQEVKETVP